MSPSSLLPERLGRVKRELTPGDLEEASGTEHSARDAVLEYPPQRGAGEREGDDPASGRRNGKIASSW